MLTTSSGGTYCLKILDELNLIQYRFTAPTDIDDWCLQNIGKKYVTWYKEHNVYIFYKKHHQVLCNLVWGHEDMK